MYKHFSKSTVCLLSKFLPLDTTNRLSISKRACVCIYSVSVGGGLYVEQLNMIRHSELHLQLNTFDFLETSRPRNTVSMTGFMYTIS